MVRLLTLICYIQFKELMTICFILADALGFSCQSVSSKQYLFPVIYYFFYYMDIQNDVK